MDLQNVLAGAQDVLSVRRVFGEPITVDHTTLVPTALIGGGGGGGTDAVQGGAGFGMRARPSGVFVLHGDDVSWKPAVDVNRIVLGGQLVAMTVLLFLSSVMLRRGRA